jgi:hypothetical protein
MVKSEPAPLVAHVALPGGCRVDVVRGSRGWCWGWSPGAGAFEYGPAVHLADALQQIAAQQSITPPLSEWSLVIPISGALLATGVQGPRGLQFRLHQHPPTPTLSVSGDALERLRLALGAILDSQPEPEPTRGERAP